MAYTTGRGQPRQQRSTVWDANEVRRRKQEAAVSGWDPSKFTPPPNPFANVGSAITAGGTVVNALRGAQAAAPAAAGAAAARAKREGGGKGWSLF
mgnify:CR=1 FL=1